MDLLSETFHVSDLQRYVILGDGLSPSVSIILPKPAWAAEVLLCDFESAL